MSKDYTPAEIETIQKFITDMDTRAIQLHKVAHGNPGDHQAAREMLNAAEVAQSFLDTCC